MYKINYCTSQNKLNKNTVWKLFHTLFFTRLKRSVWKKYCPKQKYSAVIKLAFVKKSPFKALALINRNEWKRERSQMIQTMEIYTLPNCL